MSLARRAVMYFGSKKCLAQPSGTESKQSKEKKK
jgi:hypothetical protein